MLIRELGISFKTSHLPLCNSHLLSEFCRSKALLCSFDPDMIAERFEVCRKGLSWATMC